MNEFTASNGIRVTLTDDENLILTDVDGAYPDTIGLGEDVDALREFFRAKEDERLGRWRSVANPEWTAVVEPVLGRICFSHECGYRDFSVDADTRDATEWNTELRRVAREYFDAHPEPKPWHDAKEGEVWIITYNGEEYPAIFQAGRFRDHAGSWTVESITSGRRIWPEDPA